MDASIHEIFYDMAMVLFAAFGIGIVVFLYRVVLDYFRDIIRLKNRIRPVS